jgi:saccharopine dehydrogenase-like NADP-dependent oxidoreductase
MRALVYGVGAVGARVARQLASMDGLTALHLVDTNTNRVEEVVASLGSPSRAISISALRQETRIERFVEVAADCDLVVLTTADDHVELAIAGLRAGAHVVSVSDDMETVEALFEVDRVAREAKRSLVIGGGFAPGFSCLLARHASRDLDVVDEIHIAKFGTGGPECARQHHKALRSDGLDWRNQTWEKRLGGTGRELCWFPDPIGGLDCYQAALPDVLLLMPAFPGVVRATARVSATRRDQATKWLPMLRRPHPEGMIGAVRAEVRGWKNGMRHAVILGALDRPAVAAGTVAAVAGQWAIADRYTRFGAGGLAELVDETVPFLQALAERGVKAAVFEGTPNENSDK